MFFHIQKFRSSIFKTYLHYTYQHLNCMHKRKNTQSPIHVMSADSLMALFHQFIHEGEQLYTVKVQCLSRASTCSLGTPRSLPSE